MDLIDQTPPPSRDTYNDNDQAGGAASNGSVPLLDLEPETEVYTHVYLHLVGNRQTPPSSSHCV